MINISRFNKSSMTGGGYSLFTVVNLLAKNLRSTPSSFAHGFLKHRNFLILKFNITSVSSIIHFLNLGSFSLTFSLHGLIDLAVVFVQALNSYHPDMSHGIDTDIISNLATNTNHNDISQSNL